MLKLSNPPVKAPFIREEKNNGSWIQWLLEMTTITRTIVQSGTTAQRPTKLFTGQQYFDTTLDQPIWVNAAGTGWVDATGASV